MIASGVIAVAIGGAAIVGATASGAPSLPDAPAAVPAAAVPQKPAPILHLPTTLRLVTQTAGVVKLDARHQVFSDAVNRPSSTRVIGTAALTCTGVNGAAPSEVCNGAIALRGGVLLVNETLDIRTAQVTGSVVGGSGDYAGASGNLTGQDRGAGKTTLTLNYSLG